MRTLLLLLAGGLGACQPGSAADVGTTGTNTGATTTTTTTTTTSTTTTSSTGCPGLALLGCGSHDLSSLVVDTVLDADDGLRLPRDLEFHPLVDELWIVNQWDDSNHVVSAAGTPGMQVVKWVNGDNQQHFMAQPAALAFNQLDGSWASIHDTDQQTQGPFGTPADFMGPTLWTGDSALFEGGHDSHLDMLHNSPLGTGIAWEQANIYWVFDGYHSAVVRYDFGADHGLGGTYHGDGQIRQYAAGEVSWVQGVSSHVVVDGAGLVYVADTGNNRVAVLDPNTGVDGGEYEPNYDSCDQRMVSGATLQTWIDGAAHGLVAPSGLEWYGDLLLLSDNATGLIWAFDPDGNPVDWLDTGAEPGALMGMAVDPRDDSLWLVDAVQHAVRRVSLAP